MYKLVRKLLFCLDPEVAHKTALQGLRFIPKSLLSRNIPQSPVNVMGIDFPNRVGLAAGFDRSGDYVEALAKLGFGFIEVGTITEYPQSGHPKPRMFRLVQKEALINRVGFYNKGLDYFLNKIKHTKYDGVLGIDIGKSVGTPVEEPVADYLFCFRNVYPYADYIAVNISSPNTPGLRKLQYGENLKRLLEALKSEQEKLTKEFGKYVPFTIKVAPDLSDDEIKSIADSILEYQVDGLIATNSTFSREGVEGLKNSEQQGGLSGRPLFKLSTEVLKKFNEALGGRVPIIACGGIMSGEDAAEKIAAGASLVQVFTGLIYQGPGLVKEIAEKLK